MTVPDLNISAKYGIFTAADRSTAQPGPESQRFLAGAKQNNNRIKNLILLICNRLCDISRSRGIF
jgi:hypothetical protein